METLIRYLPNLDLVNENHHGHVILMSGSRPYRNEKDTSSDYPSANPLPSTNVPRLRQVSATADHRCTNVFYVLTFLLQQIVSTK